jgi:hypothetical protein
MKSNSMLLKASVLLLTPALFAYGADGESTKSSSPIAIGAEIQGHMVNASWHTKSANATSGSLDKMTAALNNASGFTYQEANDKLPNYTFGGRVTAKSNFSDDFSVMLAFGFETGMQDGKGYRPIDLGVTSGATVTLAAWDLYDTTNGISTWKNKMVMAPALFVGYGSVALGVEYDMREYEISGHETALTTYLNKTIKDNQVLFGFRGEQSYDMDDMKLCVSVEFMTNLGTKADSDTETYFKDLAKYAPSAVLADSSGVWVTGATPAVSTIQLAASRAVVSSVHTNLTKASVGVGVLFAEF